MNIQVFIFKLVAITSYILRFALLVLPISLIVVISKEGGWQYGFTFIQNNIGVALFVAFAVGFLVALYHALSYELVGEGPLSNYLRTKQNVNVKGGNSIEKLERDLNQLRGYKDIKKEGDRLTAKKNAMFLKPDQITIEKLGEEYSVESKPFTSWWFIDFGRNFKTVKQIAKAIKSV